jgi:hypothetical protein
LASVFGTTSARPGHWAKPAAKTTHITSNDATSRTRVHARGRAARSIQKEETNTMAEETADDDLLDVPGASAYALSLGFRIAPKSLNKLRSLGGGPSFRRFGRRVLYRRSTFHAWLISQLSGDIAICREVPSAGP